MPIRIPFQGFLKVELGKAVRFRNCCVGENNEAYEPQYTAIESISSSEFSCSSSLPMCLLLILFALSPSEVICVLFNYISQGIIFLLKSLGFVSDIC